MSITEHERHHLYELAKSHWDEDAAITLSTLITTMNHSDLTTKADLAAMRDELFERFDRIQARFVTWLLASQTAVVAAVAVIIAVK